MSDVKPKPTRRKIEFKINPAVRRVINELTHYCGYKNHVEFMDDLINDRVTTKNVAIREIKKINGHLSSNLTQAVTAFKYLYDKALIDRIPLAFAELEALAKVLNVDTVYDAADSFQKLIDDIPKLYDELLNNIVRLDVNETSTSLKFKQRLKGLDINQNLPKNRNFYTRHSLDTFNKLFKKQTTSQDAYNRRALMTKLQSMTLHVIQLEEGKLKVIWNELDKLNDFMMKTNERLDMDNEKRLSESEPKDITGISEIYTVINDTRIRVKYALKKLKGV